MCCTGQCVNRFVVLWRCMWPSLITKGGIPPCPSKPLGEGLLVDVAHSHWLVVVCCQRPTLFFFLLSYSSTRVLYNVFFPYFLILIFFHLCLFYAFYGKILISWPRLQVWKVDPCWLQSFLFGSFLFLFSISYLNIWLVWNLFLCFYSYRVITITWLGSRVLQDN
jgi:hypothetical protein